MSVPPLPPLPAIDPFSTILKEDVDSINDAETSRSNVEKYEKHIADGLKIARSVLGNKEDEQKALQMCRKPLHALLERYQTWKAERRIFEYNQLSKWERFTKTFWEYLPKFLGGGYTYIQVADPLNCARTRTDLDRVVRDIYLDMAPKGNRPTERLSKNIWGVEEVGDRVTVWVQGERVSKVYDVKVGESGIQIGEGEREEWKDVGKEICVDYPDANDLETVKKATQDTLTQYFIEKERPERPLTGKEWYVKRDGSNYLLCLPENKQIPFSIMIDGCLKTGDLIGLTLPQLFPGLADEDCLAKKNRIPVLHQILAKGVSGIYTEGKLKIGKLIITISNELPEMGSGSFFVAESEREGYFITYRNETIIPQPYRVSEAGEIISTVSLKDRLTDKMVRPPGTLWQKVEEEKLKELQKGNSEGFEIIVPKQTLPGLIGGVLGTEQYKYYIKVQNLKDRIPIEFGDKEISVNLKIGKDEYPIKARTVEELKKEILLGLQQVGLKDFLDKTVDHIRDEKYDTLIEPSNLAACCASLKWEKPSPWRIELPTQKNRPFVIHYGPRLDQHLEVQPVKGPDKWRLRVGNEEFDTIEQVLQKAKLPLEDCVSNLPIRKKQYDKSLSEFLSLTVNCLNANKYTHRMDLPELAEICATLKGEDPRPWRIESATLQNPKIVIQHGPQLEQRLEVEPVKRGEKWHLRFGDNESEDADDIDKAIKKVLTWAKLRPDDCVGELYVRKVEYNNSLKEFRAKSFKEFKDKKYDAKINPLDLEVICTTLKEENPYPWRIELPTRQNQKIVIEHGPKLEQRLEVEPVKREDKWRLRVGDEEFDTIEQVLQEADFRLQDCVSNLVDRKKQYDTSLGEFRTKSFKEFKDKKYDAKINPLDLEVICATLKEENPQPWRIELPTQQNQKIVIEHGPKLEQRLEVEPLKRGDRCCWSALDREFDNIEAVVVQGAGFRLEDSVSNLVDRKQYKDHIVQLQQSQASEYREWVLKECKAKKYDTAINQPELGVICTALKGENPHPWRIELPTQQNPRIVIQHGANLEQSLEIEPVKRGDKWYLKIGERESDFIEDAVKGAGYRLEDCVSNLSLRKKQYDNLVLELTGQRKGWFQLRKGHYFYEGAIHSPEEEEAQRTRLREKAKNARNPIAALYKDTQKGEYALLVCSPKGDIPRLAIAIETMPVPCLVCQDRRGATLGSILPEGVTSFSDAQALEKRAKTDDEFFSVAGQTFFTNFSSFEEVEHAVGDLRDHIPENKRVVVVFRDADKRLCLYAFTKAGAASKYFIDQDGDVIELYQDARFVEAYDSFGDLGYLGISFDQLRAQPPVPAGPQFSVADFDAKGKHFFTEGSHEQIKNRLLAIRPKIPEGHRVISVLRDGDAYYLYALRGGEESEVRIRMLAKKPDGISLMLRGGREKEKFASFEDLCTQLNALTLLDVEGAAAPEAPAPAQAIPAEAPAGVEILASGEWLEDTSDPITDAEAKNAFPALVASDEPLTHAHQFRVWVKGLAIARTEAEKARVEAAKERMKHFSIVDQFWLSELAKGSTVVAEGTRRQKQAQEITSKVFEESYKDEGNKEAMRQYFGPNEQE